MGRIISPRFFVGMGAVTHIPLPSHHMIMSKNRTIRRGAMPTSTQRSEENRLGFLLEKLAA